jgi:DNA-binding beta-propeller fold protein YncE
MKTACLYFIFLMGYQTAFAASGAFFNLSSHTTSSGTTLTITPTISNHTYSMAGIKLNSSEYSLSSPWTDCTKIANGYCLFSVNSLSSKNISITGKAGNVSITLCLNGEGPLSCQNYQVIIKYAYVANDSGQILLCPIEANNNLGACYDAAPGSQIQGPNVITFNNTRTKAYITNFSSGNASVFLCEVQSNNMLEPCSNLINTGVSFQLPFGLVLNKEQTNAYIANGSDQQVLICPLLADGTFGTCQDSGNTGISFGYPLGITINHAQTKAYVTNNGNNTVSVCPIKGNGTFGACIDSGNLGVAFQSPVGVVLNNAETKAYVTNTGNTNTVSICPIETDGTFGQCIDSGNLFNYPVWIALSTGETVAYVTNNQNSTVSICPVNLDGSFGICQDSSNAGVSFSGPEGITLIP